MAIRTLSFGYFKSRISIIWFTFLCIFSLQVFAVDQTGMWRYTVRPGDNLITLGKKHLINPGNWKEVQRLNKVKNPYRMQVGKVLYVPLGMVKQGPASAKVIFVSGQADLHVPATDGKPLAVGQKLGPGATISTRDNSKVVIQFADGTTSVLASNSQLKLDAMSLYSGGAMVDTRLRLQKGQLETHANPKHEKGNTIQVITPSAIAAVRGTKFRVNANEKVMTQETLDGRVALAALGSEVVVNGGFGSKVEQGMPPIPPVVLLPAANTAALKKHYETLPVIFELPDMQGAATWVGKVAADANTNQIVGEAETQSKQLTFADIADGEYFLNLRAKDQNGIAGYDALHQFTINARPLQPTLVTPTTDAVIREPKPLLQWNQVTEAQLYSVEISTDGAFQKVNESVRIAGTQYQLRKSLKPGQYFWRVASIAKNENGEEDKGPAIVAAQFTFKPAPPKPDISQLKVHVARNRVMVSTISPPKDMTYSARLDNDFNHQEKVWHGRDLGPQFNFLLKEYGKQTLYIKQVDGDGVSGPAAVYEFYAYPE